MAAPWRQVGQDLAQLGEDAPAVDDDDRLERGIVDTAAPPTDRQARPH
jgi:hypothetical protein